MAVLGQLPSAAHNSGVLSTGTDGQLSPRRSPSRGEEAALVAGPKHWGHSLEPQGTAPPHCLVQAATL